MGYFGDTFPTKDELRPLILNRDAKGLVDALGHMAGRQDSGRSMEELITRKLRELITSGDRWAIEPLIRAATDPTCRRHFNLFMTLVKIKDDRVLDMLVGELAAPDLRVRLSAAQALGELQDERAVEPLLAACDDALRERVVEALKKIGSEGAREAAAGLAGQAEETAPAPGRELEA